MESTIGISGSDLFIYGIYLVLGIFALCALAGSFFTVQTASAAIVERWRKFNRVATAGLKLKIPFIERVVSTMGLKVYQLKVEVDTKTKDNVFVTIPVAIQYRVLPDKVVEAHYKLANPTEQIEAYVQQVILSHVPKMDLDSAFENQGQIAEAVRTELEGVMAEFGYVIVKAVVTDVEPPENVVDAMNDINASLRSQEAAKAKGEAEKILRVKQAEAEAEAKVLQGEGIAGQRKAIIAGLKESVADFQEGVKGATAQDVMALVMTTQYFDTLKEIGASGHASTIFVQHSPDGGNKIMQEVANGLLATVAR